MIVLLGWPSPIYLFQRLRRSPWRTSQELVIAGCFASALVLSITVWLTSMRSGVQALNRLSD